jgi:hypothetical protein
MTAREMAEDAVLEFFRETGECPGIKLACNTERNQLAYAYAWENFLNEPHDPQPIPDFCIVEDFVHGFLKTGMF